MAKCANDLLTDPVFSVRRGGVIRHHSLPEVLALLGKDEVDAFTGLQAHQAHAWHAFLVQLAAVALASGGGKSPSLSAVSAKRWRELLTELADGEESAWRLVEPDLRKPAFMQPPMTAKRLDGWKGPFPYPDEIDVLVTAKNHDVKGARVRQPAAQHWAYALVSLQTMQGFLGRGNYGIARMNGGFASRPGVGVSPDLRLAPRFRRDVKACLEARDSIGERLEMPDQAGIALLWLDAWDGKKSLPISHCDPLFIEICRRVRLVAGEDDRTSAWTRPTDVPRVDAERLNGDTGDPWTPVNKAKGKAFTATRAGFAYRVTRNLLLSGEFRPGAALQVKPGDGAGFFIGQVLARGQGETNGLHERYLPLPPRVLAILRRDGSERIRLGALAERRVAAVDRILQSALKPALLTLLQAAPERLNFKDKRADGWLADADHAVDVVFFEHLWRDLDLAETDADERWIQTLASIARASLAWAAERAPIPSIRRYRAAAASERVLEGALRNKFPSLVITGKEQVHE
ncbi:MAG: type I-E CRISPR-associated protein Cse1/CasA [Anaeromyxobacteraceae bacterium]